MQITEFTNQMVTLIKSKVSTEMKNVQSHTIWKIMEYRRRESH